jgi:lipoprotein-anchoring transpeptidase ErfK/SrfK
MPSATKWISVFLVLALATGAGVYLVRGSADATAPTKAELEQPPPAPVKPEPAEPPPTRAAETPAPPQPPAPDPLAPLAGLSPQDARQAMAKLYFDPAATPDLRGALEPRMMKLSQLLIVEQPSERDFDFYEVRSGDSLVKIAERYRVHRGYKTVQYGILKLFNKLGSDLLRVGQKLRIPKGEVAIVVRKSEFKLFIFYQGAAFASYPVAIGADASSTPLGLFKIADKTGKPAWWPPESTGIKGPIGPDDPRNPLGTHWIALSHDLHSGLGIHGTNDPGSVGTRASLGCIRMKNEDVKAIFEVAHPGMAVHVLD